MLQLTVLGSYGGVCVGVIAITLCREWVQVQKGDEVTAVWMWGAHTILSPRCIPLVLPVRIHTTGGKPLKKKE